METTKHKKASKFFYYYFVLYSKLSTDQSPLKRRTTSFISPILAEEVIFLVKFMCVSVCALQAEPLDLWT